MATDKESLTARFRAMRFNDNKHLGLGDVRLTLWEQEQIEKEFAELEARLAVAEAEVVRLRGQVAALKGRVPDLPVVFRRGDPLPRFGIRWSSPTEPICVPMDDGYWTVWHYADAALAELEARCAKYKADSTRLDKLQESFIKGEEFHIVMCEGKNEDEQCEHDTHPHFEAFDWSWRGEPVRASTLRGVIDKALTEGGEHG